MEDIRFRAVADCSGETRFFPTLEQARAWLIQWCGGGSILECDGNGEPVTPYQPNAGGVAHA